MPGKYLWTPPERNTEDAVQPPLPGMPKLQTPRIHPHHPMYHNAGNRHIWGELAHPDLHEHNPFLSDVGARADDGSDYDRGRSWRQESGGYADKAEMDEDNPGIFHNKVQRHINGTMSKALPALAIPSYALHQVLDSGRVKSQFETDRSGGSLSPDSRRKIEHQFFGYPHDLPGRARPIYGYLTHNPAIQHPVAGGYGQHTLILHRPRIWHRTSAFIGDTLDDRDMGHSAHPVQDFQPSGFPEHGTEPKDWRLDHGPSGTSDISYTEAHYHGGVNLGDVHYAVVHGSDPDLIRHLHQSKVPWVQMKHEGWEDRGKPSEWHHYEAHLMASVQKGAFMQRNTKIIGQQGPHRYLIDLGYDNENGDRQAQIADVERGELHGPRSKDSILARGYWKHPTDDVDTEDILPLVKPV